MVRGPPGFRTTHASVHSLRPLGGRLGLARGRERLFREQVDGVGAQSPPEGLQRQHLLGRDVAEVGIGADAAYKPGLLVLARCFEKDLPGWDAVDERLHEISMDFSTRPE